MNEMKKSGNNDVKFSCLSCFLMSSDVGRGWKLSENENSFSSFRFCFFFSQTDSDSDFLSLNAREGARGGNGVSRAELYSTLRYFSPSSAAFFVAPRSEAANNKKIEVTHSFMQSG